MPNFLLRFRRPPACFFVLSNAAHTANIEESAFYQIGEAILANLHHPLVFGNTSTGDTVAVTLHQCTTRHEDTIGMNQCLATAYASYDKILNEIYQFVLSVNDDDTRKALRLSQRKWIAFRDQERMAQFSYGKTDRGTILGLAIGYQDIAAIRERISELMFYLAADQQ